MSYGTKLAAYLSGATVSQLNSWAKNGVLMPELSMHPRRYSFRDIVALRVIAKLRAWVSMQKIRAAINTLEGHDFTEHLSEYRIASDGDSVKLWTEDGFMDLVENPGQLEFSTMEDIYAPFENFKGRSVPSLLEPHDGIELSPARLGGVPTIQGTRVPFDLVSELSAGDDPMEATEIVELYPTVDLDGVKAALDFNEAVERVS